MRLYIEISNWRLHNVFTCLEKTAMSSLKDSDEQTSPPATPGSRGVHVASSHFSKMSASNGKSGCLKTQIINTDYNILCMLLNDWKSNVYANIVLIIWIFFLFSWSLSTLFGFFDHSLMGSYIFCYIPLVMMDDRLTLISSASLRQKWARARAPRERKKKKAGVPSFWLITT